MASDIATTSTITLTPFRDRPFIYLWIHCSDDHSHTIVSAHPRPHHSPPPPSLTLAFIPHHAVWEQDEANAVSSAAMAVVEVRCMGK